MCYSLLIAGRWLKQYHPEVREPADWTEALAAAYVTYTRPGPNLAICCYQQIRGPSTFTRPLDNSAPGPLTDA